jgi:hypothetical protein
MTDPVRTTAQEPAAAERRHASDRRAEPDEGRRAPRRDVWLRWLGIAGRDLVIIVVTVGAIVFAVRRVRPIFANQPTVVQQLTTRVPATRAVLAPLPSDTSRAARVTARPEFERDRRAFAADLVKTGRMTQARADSIAYYAVREAYLDGIPPAVVFGVMLTENALFVSGAMSNVGAVGLMQVYPKVWLKALSAKFGKDLASDSTNLKYGIYILGQYIKSDSGRVSQKAVSSGLLRYNGCVRGTNTPNCRTYPAKVKTYVERQADAMCGDKSFYDCIAKPFIAGLFGKDTQPPATSH